MQCDDFSDFFFLELDTETDERGVRLIIIIHRMQAIEIDNELYWVEDGNVRRER